MTAARSGRCRRPGPERSTDQPCRGLTLPEALLALALLGLLAGLGVPSAQGQLNRRGLELGSQLLGQALERARAAAEQRGEACGLGVGSSGWLSADAQASTADGLPPCLNRRQAALQPATPAGLQLHHNFPPVLRISRNGLVLDGGTAVLSAAGTDLRRCLVVSPPLGIVRQGRYQGDPSAGLSSGACLPDASL